MSPCMNVQSHAPVHTAGMSVGKRLCSGDGSAAVLLLSTPVTTHFSKEAHVAFLVQLPGDLVCKAASQLDRVEANNEAGGEEATQQW